jgi:RNA-directed DNA polymerase
VRYADEGHIYVRSAKAGQGVLASLTRYRSVPLKLNLNETQSAVDGPWKRKWLGFRFTARRPTRRWVAEAALKRLKAEVRRLTGRTRGVSLARGMEELKRYLKGWKASFEFAEVQSLLRERAKWIGRRLHCYLYRELKARKRCGQKGDGTQTLPHRCYGCPMGVDRPFDSSAPARRSAA